MCLLFQVKKTTEAFNNYFNNNSTNSDKKVESDVIKMPPPKFAPIKKRKSKRPADFSQSKSAPTTPLTRAPSLKEFVIPEEQGSDSDSEFGFGSVWSKESVA